MTESSLSSCPPHTNQSIHPETRFRTVRLSGLRSSSQQSSQQFGYRHSDVVVGSFEGSETQSGHVLQLAGPQERRLTLQLQQTLTGRERPRGQSGQSLLLRLCMFHRKT